MKPNALGNPERKNDTSLDLLTGLPGGFADLPIFSAGSIEMSCLSIYRLSAGNISISQAIRFGVRPLRPVPVFKVRFFRFVRWKRVTLTRKQVI